MLKANIEIQNLKIQSYIGCTDQERCEAQDLTFDISIYFNARLSMETDRLEDTIDYISVKNWIEEVCHHKKVNLLEHLAQIVTQTIYKNAPLADEIHIKIKKFSLKSQADHVAVGLITQRQNLS